MARIAGRAEEIALPGNFAAERLQGELSITDAISFATCATALNLNASAIITPTVTGLTAKMVAKYRPQASVVPLPLKSGY